MAENGLAEISPHSLRKIKIGKELISFDYASSVVLYVSSFRRFTISTLPPNSVRTVGNRPHPFQRLPCRGTRFLSHETRRRKIGLGVDCEEISMSQGWDSRGCRRGRRSSAGLVGHSPPNGVASVMVCLSLRSQAPSANREIGGSVNTFIRDECAMSHIESTPSDAHVTASAPRPSWGR